MIIAGIDEAGLGPVLGPLVVSAVVFRVGSQADAPAGLDTPDLWSLLASGVSKKKSRAKGKIAVGDSKKLFDRKKADGLVPLERGVLTMLMSQARPAQKLPTTLAELLDAVAPGAKAKANDYPWYGSCDLSLPRQAGATDVELTANSLRLAMRQGQVELLDMRAEPVFVSEYNRLIAATNNKSTTTFDVTCRMIMHVCRCCGDNDVRITVDRQGGRIHYRQPLQRIFPGSELKILEESDLTSEYRLRLGQREIEIAFKVGGEGESMAVALASMLCKYIRELCMECFNDFWAGHVAGIEPTAGYYVDGRRFYGQIAEAMSRLGINPDSIYRTR